jgi:chromosome partitioning protein
MFVITIGNGKGGVGKSTIACNLAVESAKSGIRTLLVDSDSQQSSMDFRAARGDNETLPQFQAISLVKNTIHKDVREFKDFSLIIIDAGGRDTAVFRSALLACDTLIIPVLPSQYDIWAANDTIGILNEAQAFKDINACFIMNQLIPNAHVSKEAIDALSQYNIPVLETRLHARVAYKQSISEGKGATEYDNGKAAGEITALWTEVKKWL